MQTGPVVKLSVDLIKTERYFPLDYNLPGGFEYYLRIDRQRYDRVESFLSEYGISDSRLIQEFCFIIVWIEKETEAVDDPGVPSGKFFQMWVELDNLKDYLLKNRVTAIRFEGESERNKPSNALILKEGINIDRICDGIRSIFRDEFHHDREKRRTRGQAAWKRRKMDQVKNKILNYMDSIPDLEMLSLEDQSEIIEKLAVLAGLPE